MKSLAIAALLLFQAAAAQAATIAIKNNTGTPQRLVVMQDGRIMGYVDRLKHGKTLVVKVNDAGTKPIVVLHRHNDQRFIYLPLKTRAYKLSWLNSLVW